jgi:hypothetical protein
MPTCNGYEANQHAGDAVDETISAYSLRSWHFLGVRDKLRMARTIDLAEESRSAGVAPFPVKRSGSIAPFGIDGSAIWLVY